MRAVSRKVTWHWHLLSPNYPQETTGLGFCGATYKTLTVSGIRCVQLQGPHLQVVKGLKSSYRCYISATAGPFAADTDLCTPGGACLVVAF